MPGEKQDVKDPLQETKTLMACVEVGKLLTSTLNLREILELIMLKVSQLVQAQNWSLLLKDEKSNELIFEVVVGINKELIKEIRLKPGEGIAGHVAETGKPIYLSNAQNDPRFNPKVDNRTGFTTQSIICIPLQTHGKTLGVIEIVNIKDMEIFKSRDLPILTVLADYAAIAVENSRYFARIQKMSITDEYTGLHNARYLYQILDALIRRSFKKQTDFAVVFVDIDNFKDVVDRNGHLLGSQVLKEIGKTISCCLSGQDKLFKYGGDEYVIIFPDRNRREAIELAEKILQSIRSSTYLNSEPTPVKVTASFGLAMFPEDAKTRKELLLIADNSMYRIKKSTKNGIGMI